MCIRDRASAAARVESAAGSFASSAASFCWRGVSLSGGTGNGSTVQPGYQGGQSSGGSTLTDILTLVAVSYTHLDVYKRQSFTQRM